MRIITLEEHVIFPELTSQIPKVKTEDHALIQSPMMQKLAPALADVAGGRLNSMDKNGISLQVLSVVGAGADLLDPADAPSFAMQYNNALSDKIADHLDRFAAFAHLPMTVPEAAADELERTVKEHGFKGALINGLTKEMFLDDPMFAPVMDRAVQLGVPIYLHPGMPPKQVADAYYSGLPKSAGAVLSVAGWGWHSETALHILRLIVSGTLDKYPGLKIIIGHMGEMLPMMMVRCDHIFKPGQTGANKRTVGDTLREQVSITTSGIFTIPPLLAAVDTFGIDSILFSVDYPFSTNEEGIEFLNNLPLEKDAIEKISYKNAERVLKIKSLTSG